MCRKGIPYLMVTISKHFKVKNSSSFETTKQSQEIGMKVRAKENEEMVAPAKTAQLYGMTTHSEEAEKMSTPLTCYPCDQIKVNNPFTLTLKWIEGYSFIIFDFCWSRNLALLSQQKLEKQLATPKHRQRRNHYVSTSTTTTRRKDGWNHHKILSKVKCTNWNSKRITK